MRVESGSVRGEFSLQPSALGRGDDILSAPPDLPHQEIGAALSTEEQVAMLAIVENKESRRMQRENARALGDQEVADLRAQAAEQHKAASAKMLGAFVQGGMTIASGAAGMCQANAVGSDGATSAAALRFGAVKESSMALGSAGKTFWDGQADASNARGSEHAADAKAHANDREAALDLARDSDQAASRAYDAGANILKGKNDANIAVITHIG